MKKKVRNRGFKKRRKRKETEKVTLCKRGKRTGKKGTEDLYWCIAGGAKKLFSRKWGHGF